MMEKSFPLSSVLRVEPSPFLVGEVTTTGAVLAAAALFLGCTGVLWQFGNYQDTKKGRQCLPFSPASMFQVISQLGGLTKPQFLLEQARAVGRNSYRLSVPLSTAGTYVIGDGPLAREILHDPTTDKALALFQGAKKIFFGCPTMLTVSNFTEHLRVVRKGTAYAFSQREVRRMNEVSKKYALKMVDRIAQNNGPFNPSIETTRFTFMVICEAAFEYPDATEEEFLEFSHSNSVVLRELMVTQEANPIRKMLGPLIPAVRNAYECRDFLEHFVRKVLDIYQTNPNKSDANTLVKLLHENSFLKGKDDQIAAESFLWIFGGFDTTGLTLSNLLILLAMHPHIQEKLRQEMQSSDEPHKEKYFQYVVKESFRFAPVSALGSFRQVGREFEVETDFKIPKGAVCFVSPYVALHNRSVFSDPSCFRPERWEHATAEMEEHYYPFSAGSRSCPGQRLAYSELEFAIPLLIQRFFFSVAKEGTLECGSTLAFTDYKLVAKPI